MPAVPIRPIALVGMMGSGKTSVGRALAARLEWRFADSDDAVAGAAGTSLPKLFEREGEAAFRLREREAIRALLDETPLVLATGGGAFADPETRRLLLDRALTIWLDAPPEALARRLAGSDDRPLLARGDRLAILRRLSKERRPFYAEAHFRLDAGTGTAEELADRLHTLLGAGQADATGS